MMLFVTLFHRGQNEKEIFISLEEIKKTTESQGVARGEENLFRNEERHSTLVAHTSVTSRRPMRSVFLRENVTPATVVAVDLVSAADVITELFVQHRREDYSRHTERARESFQPIT